MAKLTRRRFALTAGASVVATPALLTWPSEAAEFNYKLGHDFSADHPCGTRTVEATKRILERTSGQVDIRVFPTAQLGTGTEMLTPVRTGGVEFYMLTPVQLGNIAQGASIGGVGFAFTDYEQAWRAMDGKLGAQIRAEIIKAGVYPMEKVWEIGFRNISNNLKPVNSVDDVQGMKVRVLVSPLFVSLWKALGASPLSMNFAELYSALQTKLVNATDNPISVVLTQNLFEATNFLSLTGHVWDGIMIASNPKALERLPAPARAIVEEEFNAAALRGRQDLVSSESKDIETLKTKGMKVNKADAASFRARLSQAGFYAEWKAKYGPDRWSALEEAAGTALG